MTYPVHHPLSVDRKLTDRILVSFEGVSKTYDGVVPVVDRLDLSVREGEFLSLLGPSGSGKTTTLMMLAGFEEPTAGEILLSGRSLANVPPHRRDIGMVFQDYALFPHMTVAQNLAYPLKLRRVDAAQIRLRVDRALEMVNLSGLGKRSPAALSGGQRQRVAVARALIFEPRLVLMDEPLGALDRQLREQLQVELKRLHSDLGLTIVYVTHDQGEALTLSDRVALFHKGRIEQLGTPRDLYERPDTPFVAGFIGDNNLLQAKVQASGISSCRVQLASGQLLDARPVRAFQPGDDVLLAIRPEAIRIGGGDGSAAFDAVIEEVFYLGDQTRLRCVTENGGSLQVKISAFTHTARLEPGERIPLVIDRDAVRALPPERSDGAGP